MGLYQEIIFLDKHFKGKWCVENVMAYYKPLIEPQKIGRHWYWANFKIADIKVEMTEKDFEQITQKMIAEIIVKCKEKGKYIGICGQAPSDHKDFAEFLVDKGIESMSLNPDTVVATTVAIAEEEKESNS